MTLLEQFVEAARAAAAHVEIISRNSVAIAAAIQRAAPGARRIAVAESRDLPAELLDATRKLVGVLTGRSKTELATADVGVTEAFAGVARTGSLCVAVDEGDSGYISLLARTHIAIVAADTIVENPSDLFRRGADRGARSAAPQGLTRNFVFITGPSATADMGPLVRGVHGPHHLHILILE
jgi:L-lactate dehydrogenase complex protein LldG